MAHQEEGTLQVHPADFLAVVVVSAVAASVVVSPLVAVHRGHVIELYNDTIINFTRTIK